MRLKYWNSHHKEAHTTTKKFFTQGTNDCLVEDIVTPEDILIVL